VSTESVRAFLAERAPDIEIMEFLQSTATVEEAARAHGVKPGQIAKTLSLKVGERSILVVTCGDVRLDNKKAKTAFGGKTSMLTAEEVLALTGHRVGGVCPFGLASPLNIYCDVALKRFNEVVLAAGAGNSTLRIAPERMAELSAAEWVDVCREAASDAG
jgi:prolyl-tRNA editing enzyme YbaK/EbsC (Cys-tRNA(Pro) deacylase)